MSDAAATGKTALRAQRRPAADARFEALQAVADRAHDWYRGHGLDRQVDVYQGLLFP